MLVLFPEDEPALVYRGDKSEFTSAHKGRYQCSYGGWWSPNNYVDVFEKDVYFLNTELKLIKLTLNTAGNGPHQESIVPIPDQKIEDFFLEAVTVNGVKGCKITYITDKGVIKEYGANADPNKLLDCTKYTQNVNYWNKVVRIGKCVLVSGYNKNTKTNTLVLGEGSGEIETKTLAIPHPSGRWDRPILRMLEIPSKKHKGVTFVLAAECFMASVHLLALTLGKKKRMEKIDQKQVSSSDSYLRSVTVWIDTVYFGVHQNDRLIRRLALRE